MTKISFLIIVFAVVFLSGCIGETDIIRGSEGVFDIEINNTNLAPSVPGETVGTGERVHGVTYYANETPIEIFVWGHGQNVSQTAEIHLFINGTKVADTSGRPLGASEQSNKTIVAMIPRYASYKIEANNAHHYEWREYRVIAGTNGSVITNNYYNNTTGGGSVVSFNGTPVDLNGSNLYNGTFDINTNLSLKVNKSGDNMTGTLNIQGIKIGDFQNFTTQGFLFNSSSYSAAFSSYNDTDCMYSGNAVNAYYDGVFSATQGWHKSFKDRSSIIIQSRSCAIGLPLIDGYISSPTTQDPFLNFNQVYSFGNKSATFMKNLSIQPIENLSTPKNPSGITMLSPDGNDWCITVTNLGALSVSSTPCG